MRVERKAACAWRSDSPRRRTGVLGNRFGRAQRLTASKQYAAVFSAKTSMRSERLLVYARANNLAHGRLGLTVGRKLEARAVARNYMKRLLRDIFRRSPQCFEGMDWVVAPRRPFDHESQGSVEAELLVLAETLQRRWRASSSS